MARPKGIAKTGGRQKGTPNKLTAELKECILKAAELAGDENGTVGYLHQQAKANPTAFLTLLGKVLPLQVAGANGGGLVVEVIRFSDAKDQAAE